MIKIPEQITLNQSKSDVKLKSDRLYLAAASEELRKKIESITFIDDNSRFLVRLLQENGKALLFFFPPEEIKAKQFKLRLLPSDDILSVDLSKLPIELIDPPVIQKIQVEII